MNKFQSRINVAIRRGVRLAGAVTLLLMHPIVHAQADALTFEITPTPAWVTAIDPPRSAPATAAPVHYLLIDEQNVVNADGSTHFSRSVKRVNAQSGLVPAAQMELGFNPAYQTLALHTLEVRRGERRIDLLDRRHVRLFQRETDLERQMYNGFATASIVLPDVRVGDEIELAYSISGQNPVFEGNYFVAAWMQARKGPTQLYRVSFNHPRGREFQHDFGAAEAKVVRRDIGNRHEIVVSRTNVPQTRLEPAAAWSVVEDELIEMSEFPDWAAVARWGSDVFSAASANGIAATQSVAADIRRTHATRDARVLAAIDFVQKEIRYFGTEIGPYSHRPVTPRRVLDQRFGDCKDKVVLLQSLLRHFQVRSTPVLVSSRLGARAQDALASPRVFDHAILAVHMDDETVYIDPTRRHQSGTLKAREVFGFDAGLHLSPSTTQFSTLPNGAAQLAWELTDTYVISEFDQPAELTSTIRYHGIHAEGLSENLANLGQAQVMSQLNSAFNRLYQQLEVIADPQVTREADIDAVTMTQRFRVGDFWLNEGYRVIAAPLHKWSILEQLQVPSFEARTQAMGLSPGRVRHTVVVEYPVVKSIDVDTIDTKLEGPEARYDGEMRSERGRVVSRGEVTITGRQVSADDWLKHTEFVRELADHSTATLSVPTLPESQLPRIRKEYEAIERTAKRQAVTERQRESLPSRYLLTERLKAGRLPPKLRAEVLWERGLDNDYLGDYTAAQRDFTAARQLEPDDSRFARSWAANALYRGQYGDAIATVDRLLAEDPDDIDYKYLKARAQYFSGELSASRALFREIVDDSDNDNIPYSLIYLSYIAAQQGGPVLESEVPDAVEDEWARSLAEHALGIITDRELIKRGKRSSKRPQHLCEAYYYIGERHRINGDQKTAKRYMQRTIKQGVTEYVEHAYALNALKEM